MSEDDISFRLGTPGDASGIAAVFEAAVTITCRMHYDDDQIRAWRRNTMEKRNWLQLLLVQYVVVAERRGVIVGFATLEGNRYLDMLFVHPKAQRWGIAKALYKKIEQQVLKTESPSLTVQASISALPFFEKMGFSIITRQSVPVLDQYLTNFLMEKIL